MSVLKKLLARYLAVSLVGWAVLAVAPHTRAQSPEMRDEINTCNSDGGEDLFKACLARAVANEDARQTERQRARQAQETKDKEERARAAHMARRAKAGLDKKSEPDRERASTMYGELLRHLFPTHNYIKLGAIPSGDGFSLYGVHPLFSRYSFSVGPAGPRIQQWVTENRSLLRTATITRVGLASDTGSEIHFNVR